jgi:hypothetical protein
MQLVYRSNLSIACEEIYKEVYKEVYGKEVLESIKSFIIIRIMVAIVRGAKKHGMATIKKAIARGVKKTKDRIIINNLTM